MIRPDPIDHAGDYPETFVRLAEQASSVEIHVVDDVFVKQWVFPKAGTFAPQHAHKYDHLSLLAVGSVVVWRDAANPETHHAPAGIEIRAGVKHTFKTLTDNTIIYCIHNAARPDVAAVVDEHHLPGVGAP